MIKLRKQREDAGAQMGSLTPAHTHCANCGAELQGPYCHRCGQAQRHVMRHLPALTADVAESVFSLDGRLLHTLPALYLRPGFLAREYFAGRRVRYIAPFRLMFFLSVLAFLAIHLAMLGSALDPVVKINRTTTTTATSSAEAPAPAPKTEHHAHLGRVHAAWVPALVRDGINAGLLHAEANIDEMANGSKQQRRAVRQRVSAQMISVMPQTLLVLVPLFAVLLKIAYTFKSRLYVEHLIVALYSHAFIFLTLLLVVLVAMLAHALPGWANAPADWVIAGLWIWLCVHLLVAQKRIYAQGWPLTLVKYGCLGVGYLILLSFALAVAALIGLAS